MPTTFSRHSLEDQGVLALKVIEENLFSWRKMCCLHIKKDFYTKCKFVSGCLSASGPGNFFFQFG